MFDHESNLILRWLAALTDEQRAAFARRCARRLWPASSKTIRQCDDPARALGTMMFVDCAQSLGLSPEELRGLLNSPRHHAMESVAWLALEQVSELRIDLPDDPMPTQIWEALPERIVRRMNDLPLE